MADLMFGSIAEDGSLVLRRLSLSQPALSPGVFSVSLQIVGIQPASENSHIVLPRICMKYQNIFCRQRISNNVCITVWGRSQACGRQAEACMLRLELGRVPRGRRRHSGVSVGSSAHGKGRPCLRAQGVEGRLENTHNLLLQQAAQRHEIS